MQIYTILDHYWFCEPQLVIRYSFYCYFIIVNILFPLLYIGFMSVDLSFLNIINPVEGQESSVEADSLVSSRGEALVGGGDLNKDKDSLNNKTGDASSNINQDENFLVKAHQKVYGPDADKFYKLCFI